jgi:hypothetical protein
MHIKRCLFYLLVSFSLIASGTVLSAVLAESNLAVPVPGGPTEGVTLFSLFENVPSSKEVLVREVPIGTKCLVIRPYGYVETYADNHNNISVLSSEIERDRDGTAYITGKIRNLDNERIDVIIVTFALFDSEGNQIGNTYANLDYLEPKGTWHFRSDPVTLKDFAFDRFASVFTGSYSGQ